MLEYNDYKQVMDEQKQNQDRKEYIYLLDEFEGGLQNIFIQANKDEIATGDILEKVKLIIEDTQDIKIKIERI